MTKTKPKTGIASAFVEDLDSSAYGVARSLGPMKIPVYALNNNLSGWLKYSRYCNQCYVYPSDDTQLSAYGDAIPNEDTLCQLLIEWSKQFERKPVLFGTSDWFVRMLSNKQEMLRSRFLYHWIAPDLFYKINDKGRMDQFCTNAGILVPRTHNTLPEDNIGQLSKEFPFPCIVKPIHRYTTRFPVEGKVFVAHDAESLEAFFSDYPQLKGATLIQEIIEGSDDQIYQWSALVKNSGEVAGSCIVRKLQQYPFGYGVMGRGMTVANDTVETEALRLVKLLGYRGLCGLEFKYREKDGRYYFIEMNTRIPWYNGLFADAGVNLPYLAYQDLVEPIESPAIQQKQLNDIVWISAKKYSDWYIGVRHEQPISLSTWLKSLASAHSYAWWNWKDPAPFIVSVLHIIPAMGRKILKRIVRLAFRQPTELSRDRV